MTPTARKVQLTDPKFCRLRVSAGSVKLPFNLSCLAKALFGGGVDNTLFWDWLRWRGTSGDGGCGRTRVVLLRDRVGEE